MRRPRTEAQTQIPTPLPRTPRHTTRVPTVIAWLALGTGVAVLLALLTAALAPVIQALVRFPTSAELAIDSSWRRVRTRPLGWLRSRSTTSSPGSSAGGLYRPQSQCHGDGGVCLGPCEGVAV